MKARCLAIIALSVGLCSCSTCRLPERADLGSSAAYWKPYDRAASKVAETPPSAPPRHRADITGSIDPAANAESSRRARLFSSAEDHKPWPNMNSPEWLRQQEQDAREEKKVEKDMRICNGC